jgi:hypothetical protein
MHHTSQVSHRMPQPGPERCSHEPQGHGSLLLILWLLGASAALTGGAVSPLLALLVIPGAVAAMRFRAQVVWAIAGCAALTALVVAFIGGVQHGIDHPLIMIAAFVPLIA